eukprot:TRINITY_DN1963_c0_g1_i10.p1 TRINITY_DN1963_c0_g1~~TRINITY_DN1963_c0_g1_i10.p1  ORF type:complete len:264 (-),score=79.49 TRINITY_DN1963_c0_g1_i10:116-838(-)
MAYGRTHSASGRMAVAGLAALYLLAAATAFVPSGSRGKGLRGASHFSKADFVPFHAAGLSEAEGESTGSSNFVTGFQAVMLAGVFGLLAGLAPVRAEEDVAAVRSMMPSSAKTKAERVQKALKQLEDQNKLTDDEFSFNPNLGPALKRENATKNKAEKEVRVAADQTKKAEAGGSSNPFAVPKQDAPKKGTKKVIFSPADDIDPDERDPADTNQPLLFLLFAAPVSIYLFFYIAGSLNII